MGRVSVGGVLPLPGPPHGSPFPLFLGEPGVDRRDLADEAPPLGVLQVEDLVERQWKW